MKHMKFLALALCAALLFSLCAACKPAADDAGTPSGDVSDSVPPEEPSAEPSEEPSEEPSDAPADDGEAGIRLAVLSGPTGVGAAKLLDSIDNGSTDLAASGYSYEIYTDNSELVAGLSSGEIDIATMASNVAVNLYNKTDGGVQIIAVGTLGVLHILEGSGGTSVSSVADLEGKTIYSAGQGANPEYILRYLLQENGLTPGENVEVVFADATEISAKLLSGEIEYAMLPVPAATAAIAKSEGQVRAAIDVTEAWDALQSGSPLVMTAVVARTGFVEAHPDLVAGFLTDYEDSIHFVNNNIDAAAELVAGYGLTPSAAIAKLAIPQCHLAFISGVDMLAAMTGYYSVLYAIDPASVGGSLPDDGIYWLP